MNIKFCQSCGMPLNEENKGTEANGYVSEDYCIYCYKDGRDKRAVDGSSVSSAVAETNVTTYTLSDKGISDIVLGMSASAIPDSIARLYNRVDRMQCISTVIAIIALIRACFDTFVRPIQHFELCPTKCLNIKLNELP